MPTMADACPQVATAPTAAACAACERTRRSRPSHIDPIAHGSVRAAPATGSHSARVDGRRVRRRIVPRATGARRRCRSRSRGRLAGGREQRGRETRPAPARTRPVSRRRAVAAARVHPRRCPCRRRSPRPPRSSAHSCSGHERVRTHLDVRRMCPVCVAGIDDARGRRAQLRPASAAMAAGSAAFVVVDHHPVAGPGHVGRYARPHGRHDAGWLVTGDERVAPMPMDGGRVRHGRDAGRCRTGPRPSPARSPRRARAPGRPRR